MSDNQQSGGIGFCGLLTIALIVLKLCGVIGASWWVVWSPMWIPLVILAVVMVIVIIVKACQE